MALTSPALQRARHQLEARRQAKGQMPHGGGVVTGRHPDLRLAYTPAGRNQNGPWLYFIIMYCPDCLRGTAIDLVRAVPAGLPNAHELGVRRARPWRLECTAA